MKGGKNSDDNIILKFMLDEEIMDELLRREYRSRIKQNLSEKRPTYEFTEPLKKETCSVHEDGLLYLNEYLAINLVGEETLEKVIFKTADLEIIPSDRIVKRNGEILRIFPSTYYILETFMRSSNGVVSRKILMEVLETKNGKPIQDNTLNQHINRAKSLLGSYKGKPYIDTVYEVGYKWNFKVSKKNKK